MQLWFLGVRRRFENGSGLSFSHHAKTTMQVYKSFEDGKILQYFSLILIMLGLSPLPKITYRKPPSPSPSGNRSRPPDSGPKLFLQSTSPVFQGTG
jgi:hypothetical protein